MFKVGDTIRNVSDDTIDVPIGDEFVVTGYSDGYVEFEDLEPHPRRRKADYYELVESAVCTCAASSTEIVQESYFFSYTAETDTGIDRSSSTVEGDAAGDIVEVLNVFRGFLKSAGFNWVAEVNVTAEDGTWHSSNGKVE